MTGKVNQAFRNSTEKVNQLYEKYKDEFPNSFFHNLLWKLLIDKTRKLNDAAFTPVIKSGYTELGIADKGQRGYQPTGVIFGTHNYDKASTICTNLNKDLFNLTDDEASEIILTSM